MRVECLDPKITSLWEYWKYCYSQFDKKYIGILTALLISGFYLFPFLIFWGWSDKPFERQMEGFYFELKLVTGGLLIFFGVFFIISIPAYFSLKNRSYQFLPDGTIKREIKKLFLIFNIKKEKTYKMQDLTYGVINEKRRNLGFNFKNKFDSVGFMGHDPEENDKIIKFIWKFRPDLPIAIGEYRITWSKKDQAWRKYEIK